MAVAKEIPDDVRRYLKDSETFETAEPHSRLTGSYKRHTAVHNIKDVDFLVFVSYEGEKPEPADLLKSLRATLDDLPEALGYGGRAQTLYGQRRSVRVEFDYEDFHLDVVPALIPNGIDEVLLVPDREWGKWVDSHPLGYGKALSELNIASGKKVVQLVKIFKHWRTFQMQRNRPKSYWLECLILRHVDRGWVTTDGKSYAELFTDVLRSIRERFQDKKAKAGYLRSPTRCSATMWRSTGSGQLLSRSCAGWKSRSAGRSVPWKRTESSSTRRLSFGRRCSARRTSLTRQRS